MGDLQQFFGGQGFDTASVEPQADFETLPPGKYPVQVESAEVKETKAGTGHYIEVVLVILDGPAKNRKLWDRINIDNPSQDCVAIGQRCLAALSIAIGVQGQMGNSDQLLSGQCMAHVKVKNGQNEIRTYSSFEASRVAEAKKAGGSAPAAGPAPASGFVAPGYQTAAARGAGYVSPEKLAAELAPRVGALPAPGQAAAGPPVIKPDPSPSPAGDQHVAAVVPITQTVPAPLVGYTAKAPEPAAVPAPAPPSGPMPWAR